MIVLLCVCFGVCMCVHVWACMCACTCTYAHIHRCVRMHAPVHTRGADLQCFSQQAEWLQERLWCQGGGLRWDMGSGPSLHPPCIPHGWVPVRAPSPLLHQTPSPWGDAMGKGGRSSLNTGPFVSAFMLRAQDSAQVLCSQRGSFAADFLCTCPHFGATWQCLGHSSSLPHAQVDTGFCSPGSLLLRDTYDHPCHWVWIGSATANFTIESNYSFRGSKPFHPRFYLGNAE